MSLIQTNLKNKIILIIIQWHFHRKKIQWNLKFQNPDETKFETNYRFAVFFKICFYWSRNFGSKNSLKISMSSLLFYVYHINSPVSFSVLKRLAQSYFLLHNTQPRPTCFSQPCWASNLSRWGGMHSACPQNGLYP